MASRDWDGAKRVGGLSMDVVNVKGVQMFQMWCQYICTKTGAQVTRVEQDKCLLELPWADVPQNIKDALTTLNNRMQTAINAKAEL